MPPRSITSTDPPQVQPHIQSTLCPNMTYGTRQNKPLPQRKIPRWLNSWVNVGLIIAAVAAAVPAPAGHRWSQAAPMRHHMPSIVVTSSSSNQSVQPTTIDRYRADSASLDALFFGGANSVVARSVGHAEGTRTASGQQTAAYYGHIDPGNSAWNVGSFSYQHQAHSPADADRRQLQRLKSQAATLRQQAVALNVPFGLQEELNGIDLANQAPLAALGENGYVPRLAEAYERELQGADAIVWARTWAYVDPATQQLNAPGLGNRLWQVRADQARRRQAIDDAVQETMGDRSWVASSR